MGRLIRFLKKYFIEHVELRLDGTRALRALVSFAVPLVVFHWLKLPAEAVFVSTTALNLSLPDLRGDYRVRLGILGSMTLLAAISSFLGVSCDAHSVAAVLAMGGIALLGGVWRHLSADYGPAMATSSALLFLLGLSQPGGEVVALHLAALAGLGGLFATLLHGCTWFFRPQHALRYAVAETWVAASDLIGAMRPGTRPDRAAREKAVAGLERDLRVTLDRTFVILGGAEHRKQTGLILQLEEMRREVVHLTMRTIAFNTSLESVMERPDFARCLPVLDSVLKALGDAARSVAITLVMHRAENLAATKVRLRRDQHLITALDERLALFPAEDVAIAQVRAALAQVAGVLPRIQEALEKTTDHGPVRLIFAASLPDLGSASVRSLGAWMRPSARLDPVLVRYAVRMAVFSMFAVGIYKGFEIPRGYWMAFTIMVVLQPDYGSTRQRAAARITGTIGGSLLAGLILWLALPLPLFDTLAVASAFLFAYFLKREYWLAVLFVTINLVLITDRFSTVDKNFVAMRILSTLLGGGLALLAARVFWPAWEGEQFPTLLARAVRANRTFLLSLYSGVGLPPVASVPKDPLLARRRAENANRTVAASVERLLGEPAGVRENTERAAALSTYCQRITRALTALAVQLPARGKVELPPIVLTAFTTLDDLLERMAHVIDAGCNDTAVDALTAELGKLVSEFAHSDALAGFSAHPGTASSAELIWVQLAKTNAEIRAMTLALKMQSPPVAPTGQEALHHEKRG